MTETKIFIVDKGDYPHTRYIARQPELPLEWINNDTVPGGDLDKLLLLKQATIQAPNTTSVFLKGVRARIPVTIETRPDANGPGARPPYEYAVRVQLTIDIGDGNPLILPETRVRQTNRDPGLRTDWQFNFDVPFGQTISPKGKAVVSLHWQRRGNSYVRLNGPQADDNSYLSVITDSSLPEITWG